MTFPHVQSAMVNAMREEATRDELANKVQELFNEVCARAQAIRDLTHKLKTAEQRIGEMQNLMSKQAESAQ